jgi:hypothetical protein
MVLKRIGALSLAKICAIIYAVIGLIIGFFVSAIALLGTMIGSAFDESAGPFIGLFFGIGSIFLFPILYGLLGFLGGLISAAIYNLAARTIGGVEMEFEEKKAPAA